MSAAVAVLPAAVGTGRTGGGGGLQAGRELEELYRAGGLIQEEGVTRAVCELHPETAVLFDHHARAALLPINLPAERRTIWIFIVIIRHVALPSNTSSRAVPEMVAGPRPLGDVVIVLRSVRRPAFGR